MSVQRSAAAKRAGQWLVLVLVYAVIVWVIPRPAAVKPEGWRLTGIFAATITGLLLQPMAGGGLVLLAIVLSALFGGLTLASALGGYSEPTVWLVMAAFFISRALLKTGLARRMALFFVRLFGRSSLGICYALTLSDMSLATIIPSNSARSGGIILPIARSIAELYGSLPGATAALLGSFLMTGVYQAGCVVLAMFLTGQVGNIQAAQMASSQFGYTVTWASWLAAGIVPGLCSLAVVPWVVYRLNPPSIKKTPEAAAFAARELRAMGRMGRNEKIVTAVFCCVCGLWTTSSIHKLDVTITALLGGVVLLLTGVLEWEDIKNEKAAWDIFVWYGGVLRLGKALGDTGVMTELAKGVSSLLPGAGWISLFAVALLFYFYASYGFASITAHLLAMFPAFLAILMVKGAPLGLMVYAFACFANLGAGLTNYGTVPGPMYFALDYVSLKKWWLIGLPVSIVNLVIWSTVGFAWWKLIGIW